MAEYDPQRRRGTESFEVAGSAGTVLVRKLVSNGERLEIVSDDHCLKLDALLLEGISWQRERGAIWDLVDGTEDRDAVPATGGTPVSGHGEISISNEYAHVTVRKVTTDRGKAIQIRTHGRGTAINLGVRTLQALATVEDTDTFSAWFKTPFGPEDAPLEGPL